MFWDLKESNSPHCVVLLNHTAIVLAFQQNNCGYLSAQLSAAVSGHSIVYLGIQLRITHGHT